MTLWPARRTPRNNRKPVAHKNPDEVIRAFLRTLARLAPRAHGGAPVASGATREKA